MKSVLLIRHAKSSWNEPGLPDFDRPLNGRGKEDAPRMAQRLLEKNITIDAFIASPAKRARKTAVFFAEANHRTKQDIILVPELYLAGPGVFYSVIEQAAAEAGCIAIFSHNPGITEFVNELTNTHVDDMPTCSIFGVKADILQWDQFEKAEKEFWFFDYPKAV